MLHLAPWPRCIVTARWQCGLWMRATEATPVTQGHRTAASRSEGFADGKFSIQCSPKKGAMSLKWWQVACAHGARDDWAGCESGLPINLAAAQPALPHQNSSNGLYDALQRALGPQLEEAAACCRLSHRKIHCRLSAPSTIPHSVLVQVTAQLRPRRRHAAAYPKDSSSNL